MLACFTEALVMTSNGRAMLPSISPTPLRSMPWLRWNDVLGGGYQNLVNFKCVDLTTSAAAGSVTLTLSPAYNLDNRIILTCTRIARRNKHIPAKCRTCG